MTLEEIIKEFEKTLNTLPKRFNNINFIEQTITQAYKAGQENPEVTVAGVLGFEAGEEHGRLQTAKEIIKELDEWFNSDGAVLIEDKVEELKDKYGIK